MRLNRRRKSRRRNLTIGTAAIDPQSRTASLRREFDQLQRAVLDPEHRHDLSEYCGDPSLNGWILFRRALYHIEMIEPRPLFRNGIAAVFAALMLGCHATKNVNLVENPDATSRPSRIEVRMKSGSAVVVYQPVVRQDSLRGFSDADGVTPVSLAVSDIQSARTREFSGGRTALLTIGIVAAGLLAAWVALIAIVFSDDSY